MARGLSRGVRTALGIKTGTPWWAQKPKKPKKGRVARHAAHAAHMSHQAKFQPARGPHGKGYGV